MLSGKSVTCPLMKYWYMMHSHKSGKPTSIQLCINPMPANHDFRHFKSVLLSD